MDKKDFKYRGWTIDYWPKPIPMRDFDYTASHDDYDGEDDHRIVTAKTFEQIKIEIDEWYLEADSVQDDLNYMKTN